MRHALLSILFCFTALLFTSPLMAQLKLPQIFSDHMVLQQKAEVPIWGWAAAGEKITVQLAKQEVNTTADDSGQWSVKLQPVNAGGPHELVVSSKNQTLRYEDVLFGEVWLCSGQSNMEYTLKMLDKTEAIANADNDQLRLFTVEKRVAFRPEEDLESGQWASTKPETIADFSAVAYFFGKKLQEELDVPIGLIQSAWGGTVVETWMSSASAKKVPYYTEHVNQLKDFDVEKMKAQTTARYDKLLAEFGDEKKDGLQNGKALWAASNYDDSRWGDMKLPGLWENQGFSELNGVVWYRKEINIPAEVAAKGLTLHLGPIDDDDMTWINGQLVGSMVQKYNVPRIYEVPAKVLKAGKNVITVRVNDTGGGGGFHGQAEQMKIQSGDFEHSLAGMWKYRLSPDLVSFEAAGAGPNDHPTVLFNGMINPLIPYALQGAIWYQGESNAGRAYEYRELFPMMINDWRKYWSEDLDFYWVQLANFMDPASDPGPSNWAELREAQDMTLSLPKTGMAVIIDIGEADDIHPKNKEDVGLRLALQALHKNYGQDIVYSGPVFEGMKIDGKTAILSFDHTGSGLMAKDKYGYLKGFAIAGKDRKFHWARARIVGDKVEVFSPEVNQPVAVRYAWADNPEDANLYNKEGLPAAPFRTDEWPGVTKDVVKKY